MLSSCLKKVSPPVHTDGLWERFTSSSQPACVPSPSVLEWGRLSAHAREPYAGALAADLGGLRGEPAVAGGWGGAQSIIGQLGGSVGTRHREL